MADPTSSLVLEHLKALRASVERMERNQDEHTQRLGRIEIGIASLRREAAHHDEAWAEQSVRIDHLAERIARIERRLELV